uniref:Uncharacterized protein n=1 Tax=Anguilla anguilla TaxID=7936 RepID=A0A0E9SZQ4_ANGAN
MFKCLQLSIFIFGNFLNLFTLQRYKAQGPSFFIEPSGVLNIKELCTV